MYLLNCGGNCDEAFRFYEKHLGGRIVRMMKWSDIADAEKHTPRGSKNAVLHVRMEIGETVLMASDVPKFERIRSVYLSFSVSNNEKTERIYALLADGGEVYMAMGETFFAHRFGQLRDKFGTSGMVIHERSEPQA